MIESKHLEEGLKDNFVDHANQPINYLFLTFNTWVVRVKMKLFVKPLDE